jgi:hypothetical protein
VNVFYAAFSVFMDFYGRLCVSAEVYELLRGIMHFWAHLCVIAKKYAFKKPFLSNGSAF